VNVHTAIRAVRADARRRVLHHSIFKAAADGIFHRPITLIVSFPQAAASTSCRAPWRRSCRSRLGKPVVVENRAGAGGAPATGAVAKSPPDGLTLLVAASSLAANPKLVKALPFG